MINNTYMEVYPYKPNCNNTNTINVDYYIVAPQCEVS